MVTSPCLWNLSAIEFDSVTNAWMLDAFHEMVAGAAPNLKMINLIALRDPDEDYDTIWQAQQEPLWRPGTIQLPTARGALEHLVLHDMRGKGELQSWRPFTNLSALRTLRISDKVDDEAMSFLLHNSCEFTNIRDLMIRSENTAQLARFMDSKTRIA